MMKLQKTADPLADAQALFKDMGCSVQVVAPRSLEIVKNSVQLCYKSCRRFEHSFQVL